MNIRRKKNFLLKIFSLRNNRTKWGCVKTARSESDKAFNKLLGPFMSFSVKTRDISREINFLNRFFANLQELEARKVLRHGFSDENQFRKKLSQDLENIYTHPLVIKTRNEFMCHPNFNIKDYEHNFPNGNRDLISIIHVHYLDKSVNSEKTNISLDALLQYSEKEGPAHLTAFIEKFFVPLLWIEYFNFLSFSFVDSPLRQCSYCLSFFNANAADRRDHSCSDRCQVANYRKSKK